jgi:NAD(P)-dependent dehydrogenase (short-subunit alcohol dehydrogenase family)
MGKLVGKVAIITGGGQGCGLGMAQAFANEGASVVITGRVAEKLDAAIPDLVARGAKAVACPGDAGTRENAQRAVKTALDTFGRLDILVNNAQATKPGVCVEDITDEDLRLSFDSGFRGTLYHMQAAFPHLKTRGGAIINFGSKVGIHPSVGMGAYAAAKEAIRGLSRVTAKEWGRYKIRVNVLNPASLSPGAAAYLDANPEEAKLHLRDIALGYFGDALKHIGATAVFLASDDGSYVTGQTINVDGGQVML